MIKHLLPLLLAAVMSSSCALLAGLDWDTNHLANAAGTALTAATMSDEQIDELCRQSVAYADSKTPAAGAVYQQRLLKLMNKGITLASARKAFKAFADAGILVHAYLMYAFPTETEKEAMDALDFVRKCFADGLLQSAYWHRFALTAHSPIARNPEPLGIRIRQKPLQEPRFALNELPYDEPAAPDWDRIGDALKTALYNYMLGLGLDIPVKRWLR